jgi:signal transduction histidine kinase
VLWGRCVDSAGLPLVLGDFPADDLGDDHALILSKVSYNDTGIWLTERGAMLVSAKPVTDSRGLGPVRGTVIVGRLLRDVALEEDQYLTDLQQQTEVQFDLWSAGSGLLESESVALEDLLAQEEPLVRVRDDDELRAYAVLEDIQGRPALIVCATLPRLVTAQGERAVLSALISTTVAGGLFLLVLLRLLQSNVLNPIKQLTAHAVEIGHSEDPTQKLDLRRTDELGILANEFDSMIDKLAQSRQALVKAARHAGMSEIATGVLHNVGNVLNSVNVSATLMRDKTRSSGVRDLKMAMDAVRATAGDLAKFVAEDPRGEHLYPLLLALTDQITEEHASVEDELRRLLEGIDHVKLLIQSQQSYAGHSGLLETTSLPEQVEAALSMTSRSVGDGEIEIVREFENIPKCRVDRHRLLEILVNLLQNARQALQEPDLTERKLILRVRSVGSERAVIEVEDTGVGIPPENIDRIFVHGFTTKQDGHGFGLHASANAATEMGGKLSAHSDGAGKGARFTLEIPTRGRQTTGVAA